MPPSARQKPRGAKMYHSSNLFVAAVVVYQGFLVDHIDATNPKRAVFYFADEQGAKKAADFYWSGELMVNAKDLFNIIADLKTQINKAQ